MIVDATMGWRSGVARPVTMLGQGLCRLSISGSYERFAPH
jgi:hypothetical protein